MTLTEELALPLYTGKTDEECLTLLTNKNITVPQDITAHDIQKYLALKGKLLAIEASPTPACINVNRMLELFPLFAMDDPEVSGALIYSLDLVLAEGLIDAIDKTNILALGEKLISRVEQLEISQYQLGFIAKARG